MDMRRTAPVTSSRDERPTPRTRQVGYLLVWHILWFAALLAAQALREAFVFVPGFVPRDGESPRGFGAFLGAAAVFAALAVWGIIPVRPATERFTWYELWLDDMAAGQDNRALTSISGKRRSARCTSLSTHR
ncbi:hypothetical protein [Streptomyces melanogenes]|uniref:hypothetical protein n=1 Tax=Streptomyces melanogenes TaxID=67326 RepID=UPI0037BE0178